MSYPLPRNHFQVVWGGSRIGFSEVSGLSMTLDAPAFRDGVSHANQNVTMPGIRRFPNLVLRRSVLPGDTELYTWFNQVTLNTTQRRDITISLLDKEHNAALTWKFTNAFPVKFGYSDLVSSCSEPMMEIVEIAHEGMTILV